jgi:hypothetical protein
MFQPSLYCTRARRLLSTLPSAHMIAVTASSASAVASYDAAVDAYLSMQRGGGDGGGAASALQLAQEASAGDAGFVAAHALVRALPLLCFNAGDAAASSSSSAAAAAAAAAESKAAVASATPRDAALHLAVECLASHRPRAAMLVLERSLESSPTDALALRLHHDVAYTLGDARAMRAAPARAWAAWNPHMPCFGRVAGLFAFGLAECGAIGRAEVRGPEGRSGDEGARANKKTTPVG